MPKFRKKPVVIEAWQYDVNRSLSDLPPGVYETASGPDGTGAGAWIDTLEGTMHVSQGDFVIRGVKGELYPCKPDIFAATYDPVED